MDFARSVATVATPTTEVPVAISTHSQWSPTDVTPGDPNLGLFGDVYSSHSQSNNGVRLSRFSDDAMVGVSQRGLSFPSVVGMFESIGRRFRPARVTAMDAGITQTVTPV